ncbi:MAG: topoisomerase C-terminal repeat-containing protein, partial [Thermosynechococcaceae cyanobacterium]
GGRGGRSQTKKALKELGQHPDDETLINVYDGPYGPYIKHNKTNVSVPEGQEVKDLTLEQALELIAAKETSKGTKRKSSAAKTKKKATTKKTTAKKTTAKKTTTKKATATKTTAKKPAAKTTKSTEST